MSLVSRTAIATIDLAAVRHNYRRLKQISPDQKVMAVVKANAYGHGLVRVSQALIDIADGYAVATVSEAMILRQSGIRQPVTVLQGFQTPAELHLCQQYDLWPTVFQAEHIRWLEQAKSPGLSNLTVWLKINTGMNRLGVALDTADEYLARLQDLSVNVQLMSHMANADEDDPADPDSKTQQQFFAFEQLVDQYSLSASLANSATLSWPCSYRWVRPGIHLYGVTRLNQTDYRPVMTLTTKVLAIYSLQAGDSVGYGGQWTALSATEMAVLAIGYGDGYPRHASNGTPILINGHRYPLIGRVSMDMITVDLGLQHGVSIGDQAVLWGCNLSVNEVADYAETIGYELLCGISGRVHYQYEDTED